MLSFDEVEEVFFDTSPCFPSEQPSVATQDSGFGGSGYEIWMQEPGSVEERRERFLFGMGFAEACPTHDTVLHEDSETMVALKRVAECSGAVPSSCGMFASDLKESFDCRIMGLDDVANCMADNDLLDDMSMVSEQFGDEQVLNHIDQCKTLSKDNGKTRSWWNYLMSKRKRIQGRYVNKGSDELGNTRKRMGLKVQSNKKRCKEFTGIYLGQEISAHKGLIWTMKFSPDGQFLATGGEDGVVRIWRVTMVDASGKDVQSNFESPKKGCKTSIGRKKAMHATIVIPDRVFWLEQQPLQECHGHTGDILDLAWSKSNFLLSSSMDKTVRLWHVDSNQCIDVFHHRNYVTCVQFDPADENQFISGSIDGKVRIWGVKKRRVVDWADIRDAVTAVCYHPNGKGFVVGSITGSCRFYEASGRDHMLNNEIHIQSRKKSSGNRISSIQYLGNNSQKVMITSEDSKVRILDGTDIVRKYKGLSKSGSQMSASFTSDGRHIVSVGEDSRVYIWNYDISNDQSSKQTKSIYSCEHFGLEGVTVALPWSSMGKEQNDTSCGSIDQKDSQQLTLASWFSIEGSSKGCATWPQERLPSLDALFADDGHPWNENVHNQNLWQQNGRNCRALSAVWGMVIVTAGSDGTIRALHNYGLPIRI